MAQGMYNWSNQPLYTPAGGYGAQSPGGWNFVQTGKTGGAWSQTPATPVSGNVLGASTSMGGTPAPAPAPTPTQSGDGGQEIMSLLDQQYEQLYGSIGEQEAGLVQQKSAQEQIAENTYQQGARTLGGQYETSRGEIEAGQKRTLTDLADAMRQKWQQGNVMLGTRGASDSSASKQYSYALAKAGSKQQGDIMQENSRRMSSMKQTYDTNIQNLETEKNNQVLSIANWFAQSQNQLRGMKASLASQKSQQILDLALQAMGNIQTQVANQKAILDEWAVNKAQSLPQLTQMLAQNAQNLPAFQGLFANMNYGGTSNPSMFGFGQQDKDMNLFGV